MRSQNEDLKQSNTNLGVILDEMRQFNLNDDSQQEAAAAQIQSGNQSETLIIV